MLGVAHDDDAVVLRGVFLDNRLDPPHLRAGGVDDHDPLSLEGVALLGRDAVGPDDDGRPFLDPVKILQGNDAALLQKLHRLGVVDEGPEGVDFAVALVLGHVEDHVDGPSDAHAEPRRLGQPDLDVFDKPFNHNYRVSGLG
jgi:hypothetical protein